VTVLLKPTNISPNNIAVDGTDNITISWQNRGDRQYYYQVKIYKNSDSTLIYNTTKLSSLNTFHFVPANTLTNGIQYKYQITVWNQAGDFINSDWVVFKCSSIPEVEFTNVGEIILNDTYTFEGLYSQLEDVPIKSWQMILYNASDGVISISPVTFSEIISYEFAGFTNDTTYKVELQVYSQDNLLATTGKIEFYVQYETPKVALDLQAENVQHMGAVRLMWSVTQILGKSENAEFVEGDTKLNVSDGKVWFDENFNIDNNFTLEMWLEAVVDYEFNVVKEAQIISNDVEPVDTTVVWLENTSQSTPLPLYAVIGANAPAQQDILWIEDENTPVSRELGVVLDIHEPIDKQNTLWIDLGSDFDKIEILKMKNNLGDIIMLKYYNGSFHLYKNDTLIDSVTISVSKYYIYIQQILDDLTLHVEELV
jgi:hypothetical protein